jgi:twinkle protein
MESNISGIQKDSEFIRHVPCKACGSSDGNSVFSDGHEFCFVCNAYIHGNGYNSVSTKDYIPSRLETIFARGVFKSLPKRQLTLQTTSKWSYEVGEFKGQLAQIANYYNSKREVVFQKLRFADKTFRTIGNIKEALLYGENLWKEGQKKICICEGEIDTMSLSQLFQHKYPVVGIPNGTAGALKALKKSFNYLDSFEEIIFLFDQDTAGIEAANECSELFSYGKAKIASFELKDINDMLVAGRGEEVIKAMWQAKPYKPDDILNAQDALDLVLAPPPVSIANYPYEGLNKMTYGIRPKELVVLTGGTGVGKSLLAKEIVYSILKQGKKVGYFPLEENTTFLINRLIGIHINQPIHLDRTNLTTEQLTKSHSELFHDNNFFCYNNKFGSVSPKAIYQKIRYYAKVLDIKFIVLDHINLMISGLTEYGIGTNDERKALDIIMTDLRTLTEELKVSLFVLCHTKRIEGNKDHTDGAPVSLAHLRGSGSIAQLADLCVSIERSLSEKDGLIQIRILKNRFSGNTGVAVQARYDKTKGRIFENDEATNSF